MHEDQIHHALIHMSRHYTFLLESLLEVARLPSSPAYIPLLGGFLSPGCKFERS